MATSTSRASLETLPAYGACRWGFNRPGGVLFARVFPTGRVLVQRMLRFHEVSVEEAARMIHVETAKLGINRLRATYAEPRMFTAEDDDETVITSGVAETFSYYRVPMTRCDDDSVNGWQRVHDYLRDAPDGQPWLIVSDDCDELVRVLPMLMQGKTKPDEPEGGEWSPHALRMLLSARPSPAALATRKPPAARFSLGWWKSLDRPPTGVLRRR